MSAKSTYRALLRELPHRTLTNPTPLHNRIRELYRQTTITSTNTNPKTPEVTEEELFSHRVQEADQFAQYARAQRMYAMLVERYNPGSSMVEEERIRLTARRVGLDLPVEVEK